MSKGKNDGLKYEVILFSQGNKNTEGILCAFHQMKDAEFLLIILLIFAVQKNIYKQFTNR